MTYTHAKGVSGKTGGNGGSKTSWMGPRRDGPFFRIIFFVCARAYSRRKTQRRGPGRDPPGQRSERNAAAAVYIYILDIMLCTPARARAHRFLALSLTLSPSLALSPRRSIRAWPRRRQNPTSFSRILYAADRPLYPSVEGTVTRRETTPRTPHNYTTTLRKPYTYIYIV